MSQVALLSLVIEEYKDDTLSILWWDKCPNLKCHKAFIGIEVFELQVIAEIVQGTFILLEMELTEAKLETWNLYKPSCWLAKPIILNEVLSCIRHLSYLKWKTQDNDSHNLATDMRFNLKFGEYNTFVR